MSTGDISRMRCQHHPHHIRKIPVLWRHAISKPRCYDMAQQLHNYCHGTAHMFPGLLE